MNNEFFVLKAELIASSAHYAIGQVRKYDGQPYVIHLKDVYEKVDELEPTNIIAKSVAWLHDIIEDTKIKPQFLINEFGNEITDSVLELTKYYTIQRFSNLNRQERHQKELIRWPKTKKSSKLVKLADIWSNTKDLAEKDKEFAKIYLQEKLDVIELIKDGNVKFANQLELKLKTILKKLR